MHLSLQNSPLPVWRVISVKNRPTLHVITWYGILIPWGLGRILWGLRLIPCGLRIIPWRPNNSMRARGNAVRAPKQFYEGPELFGEGAEQFREGTELQNYSMRAPSNSMRAPNYAMWACRIQWRHWVTRAPSYFHEDTKLKTKHPVVQPYVTSHSPLIGYQCWLLMLPLTPLPSAITAPPLLTPQHKKLMLVTNNHFLANGHPYMHMHTTGSSTGMHAYMHEGAVTCSL